MWEDVALVMTGNRSPLLAGQRDTASRTVLIHFRPSQTDKQVNDCDRQIIGVVLTAEHRLKDTTTATAH